MSGIRFVPQTGIKKHDRETRKSIRRHVMIGRNQGRVLTPRQPTLPGSAVYRWGDWERDTESTPSTIPPRVGSDLSFLEFADVVEPSLMSDTLRFCSTVNGLLFALDPYISFGCTDATTVCIQALTSNPLHLNVMVFGAQSYMDQIFWQDTATRRERSGHHVLQHYGKALSLLRARLADAEGLASEAPDLTVVSVTTLATNALLTGSKESATNHAIGLNRLVSMKKNGVYSYKRNVKQMIEILRCDLCLSLSTGQLPLFFQDLSREPMFPLPRLMAVDKTVGRYPNVIDSELVNIWNVLHRFCSIINDAVQGQWKVPDQVLLDTVASVVYRLLDISFATNSSHEVIRLAMITFCSAALLPWRQLRTPFHWLQSEYKKSLVWVMQSQLSLLDPESILWCLLTYGIAFYPLSADDSDQMQPWLMDLIDPCELTTWDRTEETLNGFLWIGFIHDRPARELIEKNLIKQAVTADIPT